MCRFTVFASLVLVVIAILHWTTSVVASPEDESVKIYTDILSGEGFDETRAVTPHGYKSVMLQNGPGTMLACWQCTPPCSDYMCCEGPHPQCCYGGGVCMCCAA